MDDARKGGGRCGPETAILRHSYVVVLVLDIVCKCLATCVDM